MSIKSDRWIRRMAAAGMIEPFEPGQVSSIAGRKIVSYGTSSYGYDIRCAREFKIFTNINSTIVDPKAFDPNSFVDFVGDVCIIPPNSFALAHTVEYMRIPRNVLVICLGKSTYARCFSGDTRVALVDGTAPTLEDMARRHDGGELFWGYSIGHDGRVIVALLDAPRCIGRDSLLAVQLDNGQAVRATPDHEFIMRDGRTVPASRLRAGDSLMPLYRHPFRGREMVYQPIDGDLLPSHRLADEWNLRHGIDADAAATGKRYTNAQERLRQAQASRQAWAADDGTRGRRQAEIARAIRTPHETTGEAVRAALDDAGSIRGAAELLQCERSLFRRLPERLARFRGTAGRRNHRIVDVRELPGEHDVYCLTVPEAGNFALQAGVFVRNCGIIVNVTPLEPEWEGHVTLEFSNTTPLPAKIYAGEGCAQVLFIESDEVCETSYRDRGGKYQGQTGVTLPKA
jgi:deoxycytidine triphosphate deaminase